MGVNIMELIKNNTIFKKQNKLIDRLINKYEFEIQEKNSIIEEQSDIIKQQKQYIYKLLAEIENKKRPFKFLLNAEQSFNF
jgi:hypothetical protein